MEEIDESFVKRNHSVAKATMSKSRELSMRLQLGPGQYVVVPYTSKKGEEGDFLLRVLTEKEWGDSDSATVHTFVPGQGYRRYTFDTKISKYFTQYTFR